MLRLLKINNLAVIDEASLEVGPGFICLTGESGAGKSVIVDALLLLAGNRASADLVRSGCDKAIVEAEFELDDHGSDLELLEDKQLFLRREVNADGRSRAFVNGVMVPNNILQLYGDLAFEIHGQHGQQRLLKARNHLHLFDEQTGLKSTAEAFDIQQAEFRTQLALWWSLADSEAGRLREIDFLRLQIGEIEAVKPGEADADLDLRLKKTRNQELIASRRAELNELLRTRLTGDMARAHKLITALSEFQPELGPYLEDINSVVANLEELRRETEHWGDGAHDNDLQALEKRESELNQLYLKYGRNLDEVLSELAQLKQRLAELEDTSSGLDTRQQQLQERYLSLLAARRRLHEARDKAKRGFVNKIQKGLKDLALTGAVFQVANNWPDWPEQLPLERALNLPSTDFSFLFSPNPGEAPKPLARVASGGELSRVLLALINAFKRRSSRLLVFDEIDQGIGGETAHAVGAKLAQLGERHQIFCVTHFAQVARCADQQIVIQKQVRSGRTHTTLIVCDKEQRIAELARLMAGDAASENLREHARQMLES